MQHLNTIRVKVNMIIYEIWVKYTLKTHLLPQSPLQSSCLNLVKYTSAHVKCVSVDFFLICIGSNQHNQFCKLVFFFFKTDSNRLPTKYWIFNFFFGTYVRWWTTSKSFICLCMTWFTVKKSCYCFLCDRRK